MHGSEWNILFDIWMRSNKPLWGSKDVHSQRHILYTYQKCARHNWKRRTKPKIVFVSLIKPTWMETHMSLRWLSYTHFEYFLRCQVLGVNPWWQGCHLVEEFGWLRVRFFLQNHSCSALISTILFDSSFWLGSHISIQLFFIQISIYRSSCSGCHI